MAGLNKVQIIGNVGRDPEMRYTPQGTAVTNFSVAVNRKTSTMEVIIWFRVSAWERLAEICNQYLSKGRQVYIEGRIKQPDVYTDKNGVARASLEITATNVVLLGRAGDETAPPVERNVPEEMGEGEGDEIPF
jgi:single-strand DNA-binding protein